MVEATLKMEAECTSETLTFTWNMTRCHNPDDHKFKNHHNEHQTTKNTVNSRKSWETRTEEVHEQRNCKKKPTLWSLWRSMWQPNECAQTQRSRLCCYDKIGNQEAQHSSIGIEITCRGAEFGLQNLQMQSTCCHSDSTTAFTETGELTSTSVHRSFCKSYYLRR